MRTAQLTAPLLLLSTLLAACGPGGGAAGGQAGGKPGGPGGPGAMPPPEVEVIVIEPGTATLTSDLPGRLQAWRTAEVRARVEGIVERRSFTEGSDVKAGDTLFRIDARTYQAAVDGARADVEAARLNVERYRHLVASKSISQQELDMAQARLKQTQAALAKAELDLENTRVPAPIAGRIGRALVTEGALVGRGEATHLATIEQIDPIYANFTQPGAELLRLRAAAKAGKLARSDSTAVELVLEDGSVYPQPGRLLFEDWAVDPATGAVTLRAQLPNPGHELLPGMFVRVRFPEAVMAGAIRVPQRAVQAGAQGQFVMVVGADGKAAPRPIKTGGMAGPDFIVAEGLKGGEQVIVNGLQKARPGTAVVAKPLAAAGAGAEQGGDKGAAPAADRPAADKKEG